MKIRRRKCRKRYLGGKKVYEYERLSVGLPAKFSDAVEPFLNQDLDVDVRREGEGKLVIVLTLEKMFRGSEKPSQKLT